MSRDHSRGVMLSGTVTVGDEAPDFHLPALVAGVKRTLRLSEYRGQKRVVVAFYPFNWEEASARQLIDYQAQRTRVLAHEAETVAISVESIMNSTAWEREIGPFDFPLCSDFWPHGEVCARYGVLRETGAAAGAAERAVFIVDRDGRVIFRSLYRDEEGPSVEELFPILEKSRK